MRFERDSGVSVEERLARFWAWWSAHRETIAAAISDGTSIEWTDAIATRVASIHGRLDWEMSTGEKARHALCLSGMGDPELRSVAQKWVASAPPADALWEYHDTRIAVPDPNSVVLAFGDTRLPFRELRVGIELDEARECLHVEVWHPGFAALGDPTRRQIAWLMLDNAIGEDGVERWLGSIRLCDAEPEDPVDLIGLREQATALAARATGQVYSRLRGRTDAGAPVEVVANLSLKRWDHPTYDVHGQIVVPFDPDEHGMPEPDEGLQLDRLEAGLVSALESCAIFAGHEQGLGRRVVHLYCEQGGPVPPAVERWAAAAPRPVRVRWQRDPSWQAWRRW